MSQGGHIVKPRGKRRTWAIMYRDPDGLLRWEGKFATKGEGQRRLKEVLGEIDKGVYARPSSMTFEQFAENWLAGRRKIRGSTESGYGSLIKRQLIPRLSSVLLGALKLEHIEAVVSGMLEDELSSKTIHNAVTLLRTMLAGRTGPSAVRRGLMFRDPTLGLELPPLETRQVIPPSPEQVWILINVAKEIGGIGYPLTYVGAFTGVRRNEALSLQLSDVEWFEHEIHFRHAISKQRSRDGAHKWEWRVGPPKSRKSVRRIGATESVMRMLADLKMGARSDFLFPNEIGSFIDPAKFDAEIWKPIRERAKMSGTRFHDLRHFFASQLIAKGETASYVRDQKSRSTRMASVSRTWQGSERAIREGDGRRAAQNGRGC